MTAARRNGRHIVVVGFGFDSARQRDAKVRELVKKYLPKGRSGGYLDVAVVPAAGPQGRYRAGGQYRADPGRAAPLSGLA
jgi:D-alanyl-D-alanine carboxypeptidase